MKSLNQLLVAAVAVVTLSATVARADEPLLSPKAEDNRIKVVSGNAQNDPDLLKEARTSLFSPKAQGQLKTVQMGTSKNDPDLLAGIRNSTLSPKSREQLGGRAERFEIAPLK